MGKLDAEQKPDMEDRELTERESNEVSGGDGPPGTAGDGNGRVYLRSQNALKALLWNATRLAPKITAHSGIASCRRWPEALGEGSPRLSWR